MLKNCLQKCSVHFIQSYKNEQNMTLFIVHIPQRHIGEASLVGKDATIGHVTMSTLLTAKPQPCT